MTTLTDSERRLVERVHEAYMQTRVSICIRESLAIALRATGIPLSTLAALASGDWVAVPKEPTREMWAHAATAFVNCSARDMHHDRVVGLVWDHLKAVAPKTPGGPAPDWYYRITGEPNPQSPEPPDA